MLGLRYLIFFGPNQNLNPCLNVYFNLPKKFGYGCGRMMLIPKPVPRPIPFFLTEVNDRRKLAVSSHKSTTNTIISNNLTHT